MPAVRLSVPTGPATVLSGLDCGGQPGSGRCERPRSGWVRPEWPATHAAAGEAVLEKRTPDFPRLVQRSVSTGVSASPQRFCHTAETAELVADSCVSSQLDTRFQHTVLLDRVCTYMYVCNDHNSTRAPCWHTGWLGHTDQFTNVGHGGAALSLDIDRIRRGTDWLATLSSLITVCSHLGRRFHVMSH
jgi:hypothetical protein